MYRQKALKTLMRQAIPDLDELRQFLHYDTQSGDLRWCEDRSPAIKAGQLAGSRSGKNRDWYVMFKGKRYAAHHLVWFLTRGTWPRHRVLFKDGNRDNFVAENLVSAADTYSQNPQAIAYRKRQERMKAAALKHQRDMAADLAWRGDTRFNENRNLWEVYTLGQSGPVILKQFANRIDAEAMSDDLKRIGEYLGVHLYRARPGDLHLYAGANSSAPSYAIIAETLAYDAERGQFYYRRDPKRYADSVNTAGRRVVSFWGRYFSVGMLAWFMAHRYWPAPKAIGFKDGDPSNCKLSNLYKRAAS